MEKKLTKQQQDHVTFAERWTGLSKPLNFCVVRSTLNMLGGKWKLLILSNLLDGERRYGELRRIMPEISEKMLIQQLRELEADGLLARQVYHEVPPRVHYRLTALGAELRPVYNALLDWTSHFVHHPELIARQAALAAPALVPEGIHAPVPEAMKING
jgi:DNA-binding HxlR family transcriptional regulator